MLESMCLIIEMINLSRKWFLKYSHTVGLKSQLRLSECGWYILQLLFLITALARLCFFCFFFFKSLPPLSDTEAKCVFVSSLCLGGASLVCHSANYCSWGRLNLLDWRRIWWLSNSRGSLPLPLLRPLLSVPTPCLKENALSELHYDFFFTTSTTITPYPGKGWN